MRPNTKNKYNISPKELRTTASGVVCASKLEKQMHEVLERKIPAEEFHTQVKFVLQPGFALPHAPDRIREVSYVADFVLGSLITDSDGSLRPGPGSLVIDAKGVETPIFSRSQKMFAYVYGHEVHAVRSVRQLGLMLSRYADLRRINSTMLEFMKDQMIKNMTAGSALEILGYKKSSGAVSDMTVKLTSTMEPDSPDNVYEQLVRQSIAMLTDNQPELIAHVTALVSDSARYSKCPPKEQLPATIRGVIDKMVTELLGALDKMRTPADERKTKETSETLIPACYNLSLVNGVADFMVLHRVVRISETVVVKPEAKIKNVTASAIKEIIEGKLPLKAWVWRLNLYPGSYDSLRVVPLA